MLPRRHRRVRCTGAGGERPATSCGKRALADTLPSIGAYRNRVSSASYNEVAAPPSCGSGGHGYFVLRTVSARAGSPPAVDGGTCVMKQ
jgi:hypothetical protein